MTRHMRDVRRALNHDKRNTLYGAYFKACADYYAAYEAGQTPKCDGRPDDPYDPKCALCTAGRRLNAIRGWVDLKVAERIEKELSAHDVLELVNE